MPYHQHQGAKEIQCSELVKGTNLETRLASLEVTDVRLEPEAAKSVSPEPDAADTKL